MPYVKAAVAGVAVRYAGSARRIYVTHPPPLFRLMWMLLTPFLPRETRQKVVVAMGSPPDLAKEFGDEYLTAITPASLPVFLGGSVPDEKPLVRLSSHTASAPPAPGYVQ